jgi:hypothetical protein
VEVSDEKPGSDEEGGNRRKRKKRDVNDESDSESTMEDSDLQQVLFEFKVTKTPKNLKVLLN